MLPQTGNVLAFRPISRPAESASTSDVLLGPSPAIARVWSQIRRVAPYFRTALITGERGSGHAAVAHALYSLSPRADRQCITIPASEAEDTLAGPATRWSGETLFFPDIHHISPLTQQALLRITRLRRPHQVAVIAGSITDLRPLVSAGAFCSVLAAALSAIQIHVPPLRDRPDDIPTLATHLLAHEAKALNLLASPPSNALLDALTQQPWPGNLAQLRLMLQRLLGTSEPADPRDLPDFLAALVNEPEPDGAVSRKHVPDPPRLLKLDEVVQQHIRSVLVTCNGNKLRAAELLGISRSTLYRMLDAGSSAVKLPFAV